MNERSERTNKHRLSEAPQRRAAHWCPSTRAGRSVPRTAGSTNERAVVLQHIACEPPGDFEDDLVDRGVSLRRVELDEGDRLPPWQDFEVSVDLGGPMGAYQEAEHPWLVEEMRLLRVAASAGTPIWGSCLGAYGVQFPVEVTASMACAGVPAYREAAESVLGPNGLARLLGDFADHAGAMQVAGRALFEHWLEQAAGSSQPSAASGGSGEHR